MKMAYLGDSEETSTTECKICACMSNVRNKTGWEVPCSKDMQIRVENFTLVKMIGIKPLEILEHWRAMMKVTLQRDW